jgi:hypothetical protein
MYKFDLLFICEGNVAKLNRVPTSSVSGTCLFSSVVERWKLVRTPTVAIHFVTYCHENLSLCDYFRIIYRYQVLWGGGPVCAVAVLCAVALRSRRSCKLAHRGKSYELTKFDLFSLQTLLASSSRFIPNKPGSVGKAAPGVDLRVSLCR